MLLLRLRIVSLGPFGDITIPFCDDEGTPKPVVVLFGGEGVGKTSILSAIATTRPGHTIAQHQPWRAEPSSDGPPFVVSEWHLGDDDPARPHPLKLASPNARLDERDDEALLRRREQTLFDRRAGERGFVLVAISGARWFSRTAVMLTSPERTLLRYDVRSAANFDDATRTDLARETKQILSFACIASALAQQADDTPPTASRLEDALRLVLAALLDDDGYHFLGVDPVRLEPVFRDPENRRVEFDDLPRSLRHLVSFGALVTRSLAAAWPDRDPREGEGVVLLDDIESEQPIFRQRTIVGRLHRALPRVQWIITTSSTDVALGCATADLVVLRRRPGGAAVDLHEGVDAVLH
ncbi:MAG: hypothetical protein IPM54_07825 [Polyangiaceae bacterium]|nr:hypothetical protein [Polyangiaceae bacterium]